MKRLLPLALLSLLLLAPAARGGDLEMIAQDIQLVDAQLQDLEDVLARTENPQKRAELQAQIEIARAHRAKLETDRVGVRVLLDTAANQHAALRRRAESLLEKTTGLHNKALGQRQALLDQGDQKRAEAMEPTLQQAEHDLGAALNLQDVLARAEGHLRGGALHDAQRSLQEATARLDDLEQVIQQRVAMRLAAAAVERTAEYAQRSQIADEIAMRKTVAESGIAAAKDTRARLLEAIKRASDPEDVQEIKRIHERMAHFEAHVANFHSAQGLLDKARAYFDAAEFDAAQKALVQAQSFLAKARSQPMDDGSPSRPDPEFRTQRAELESLRQISAKSIAEAQFKRERLTAQLEAAVIAGNEAEAKRLRLQVARLRQGATSLAQVSELFDQGQTLTEGKRYEKAKRAFERAVRRLEELAALNPELADVAEKSDRPFNSGPSTEAHAEALRTQIADLEAQLAELSKKVTDKHDAHIALSLKIRMLKKRLAELEAREAQDGRDELTAVVDEDGRFVLQGTKPGEYRVRLVTGDHAVVSGRVVGPDGEIVTEPTWVRKPVPPVVTHVVSLKDVWSPKRVDHLRQAAKHLRAAGQTEQAERLEGQAKELEASLRRLALGRATGAGSAAVLKAIGDLRQEVRALRKEVKELKALILENRHTGVR